MRIATYNIASGGFSDYSSLASEPERLHVLQKAVAKIDADVIGVTDTFRWMDIFTPEQVQTIFNFPYSFHIDMNDTRVDKRIGVALLSRHPIIAAEPVRLHNRGAIMAKVSAGRGRLLTVYVIYLDDLSEATRQKQIQALIKYLVADGPIAVIGDLNALWPEHVGEVKARVNAFLASHSSFKGRDDYRAMQEVFDNFYQAAALSDLKRHGFTEPLESRATALTPLHMLGLPNIFPIDHILLKNCVASEYTVLTGDIFETASDHYPLVASLDW